MENLLKLQQRTLGAHAEPADVYADRAFRRLRFDLVEDQDALDAASNDRVRECFRALVRSFELSDDEDDFPPPRGTTYAWSQTATRSTC